MAHTKIDTLTDNPLSHPDAQEAVQGIVGDFAFAGERQLSNLRTDIEKEQLKKELEEVKEREQAILKYLGIDTYLGIDLSKKKRVNFKRIFSLDEEEVKIQPTFYDELLNLYFLKHPEMTQEMVDSWIAEKKNIIIEFGVTSDKSSYFIQSIQIENDRKKENIK